MKVDIGFWDINGNYIEDIQEVDEMEMEEYKDCQLCKYLDCTNDGRFCCSLDGEILDHEGICCDRFEEYKE